MCWAKRCCFCIKLDPGSIFIGIISLIFSIATIVSSAVYLSLSIEEDNQQTQNHSTSNPIQKALPLTKVLTLELTLPAERIILWLVLAMGLLMMFASMMLMIGISKKKPGYILFYFGFGIFFTIFSKLGALLLLLQKYWEESLVIFLSCGIYIHFLVVIHTLYEQTLKGRKVHGFASHETLITDDNISTASQETDIVTSYALS